MKQYRDLVNVILSDGFHSPNRTGTGTIGIFGYQMRFNLQEGFPLLTLKKTNFKPLVKELLWFLRGETNINTLGTKIWDEWADEKGELGPIYGKQWRKWQAWRELPDPHLHEFLSSRYSMQHDQIAVTIQRIKKAVAEGINDRRLIVSAWNVEDLPSMALAPCHVMFQFSLQPMDFITRQQFAPAECKKRILDFPESHPSEIMDDYEVPKYFLSCQLYQRSADVGLGVPFNIASYALLTQMVAQVTNTVPGEFIHTFGDVHIYDNHIEALKATIEREDKPLPKLTLNPSIQDIDSFTEADISLEGYDPHPFVKLDVAV
jgi:thymidylate synthase